jgi:hypothetical protein
MNTQPTPEDEQIMNDILIQLERMKQNQKNLYLQLMSFFTEANEIIDDEKIE